MQSANLHQEGMVVLQEGRILAKAPAVVGRCLILNLKMMMIIMMMTIMISRKHLGYGQMLALEDEEGSIRGMQHQLPGGGRERRGHNCRVVRRLEGGGLLQLRSPLTTATTMRMRMRTRRRRMTTTTSLLPVDLRGGGG
jgi:hypothetical protein